MFVSWNPRYNHFQNMLEYDLFVCWPFFLKSYMVSSIAGASRARKHELFNRSHAWIPSHCNGCNFGVDTWASLTSFISLTFYFESQEMCFLVYIIVGGGSTTGQRLRIFETKFEKTWKRWWVTNYILLSLLPVEPKWKWSLIIFWPNLASLLLPASLAPWWVK